MNELKHPKVLFAEKNQLDDTSHPAANIWLLQLECVLSGFTLTYLLSYSGVML